MSFQPKHMEIDQRLIDAWRLSIQFAVVPLGTFNWPWALGNALDEIEKLRKKVAALEKGD